MVLVLTQILFNRAFSLGPNLRTVLNIFKFAHIFWSEQPIGDVYINGNTTLSVTTTKDLGILSSSLIWDNYNSNLSKA